jgi:hypothetical protein
MAGCRGNEHKAAIEVCPVSGKKSATAASKAGLAACAIPTLLVRGDNSPGLGRTLAQAIAEVGINVAFVMAQVIDARFSAVMGFGDEAACKQATTLIEKAVTTQSPVPSREHGRDFGFGHLAYLVRSQRTK